MLKHLPGFGCGQPLHELGRPSGMQRRTELAQAVRIGLRQHLTQFRQVEHAEDRHGNSPFSPGDTVSG